VSPALATARRMLAATGGHLVVSRYVDFDPSGFATAPARASDGTEIPPEPLLRGGGIAALLRF
jgi:hypothetical protein